MIRSFSESATNVEMTAEQTQDRECDYLLLLFLFKGMGQDARQPGWQRGGVRSQEIER